MVQVHRGRNEPAAVDPVRHGRRLPRTQINRAWSKWIEFIGVPRHEVAIRDADFYETVSRHF
jgi:hypothetical protein